MAYDAEHRLIEFRKNGNLIATHTYDAFGRRIRKEFTSGNGTTTEYLYDQASRPFIAVTSGSTYSRGEIFVGGLHLGTYSGGTSGNTYFTYADWMGTERVRTDSSAAVAQTCAWGDYGNSPNCTTNSDPVAFSPHGYAGYEYDKESGLHHMWFRDYNPRLGRFLTADPFDGSMDLSNRQSMNRYAYVGGNPVNYFDPFGLKWKCIKNGNDITSDEGTRERCSAAGGQWVDVPEPDMSDGTGRYDFFYCSYNRAACGLISTPGVNPCLDGAGPLLPGQERWNPTQAKPKSPARQQCEARTLQQYNQAQASAVPNAVENALWGMGATAVVQAGAGCVVGAGVGGTLGAVATVTLGGAGSFPAGTVGCAVGAVDAVLVGLPQTVTVGGITALISYHLNLAAAQTALHREMQACSQIP